MKTSIKQYVHCVTALTMVAAMLTACSDDNDSSTHSGAVEITTSVATTALPATRADGSAVPYAPEGGTLTLCYASLAASDTEKTNYKYTEDGWAIQGTPLYWDNLTAQSSYPFFAAAPAIPAATPAVATDQDAEGAYLAADQLLAYTTTAERRTEVALTFKHILSQFTVKIEASAAIDSDDYLDPTTATSITLRSAYTGYVLNSASPSSDAPAVVTTTQRDVKSITMKKVGATFYAVLPPQGFEADGMVLTVKFGIQSYTWTNTQLITLLAGTNHQLTLKVKRNAIVLAADGIMLMPWDNTPTPMTGDLKIVIEGEPDAPIEGAQAATFTTMQLWKNEETPLTYEKADPNWTLSTTDAASGKKPFSLNDLQAEDKFYATAENSEADGVTGFKDIVACGPVVVKAGQLNLTFQHLLAQLKVELTAAADFPLNTDALKGAVVKLKNLASDYTLTGITLNPGTETKEYTLATSSNVTASVLVVPQEVPATTTVVHVTLTNGQEYSATLPTAMQIQAGKLNMLKMTLHNTTIALVATVKEWDINGTTINTNVLEFNTPPDVFLYGTDVLRLWQSDPLETDQTKIKHYRWDKGWKQWKELDNSPFLLTDATDKDGKPIKFFGICEPNTVPDNINEFDILAVTGVEMADRKLTLEFKHLMSQIQLKLVRGADFHEDISRATVTLKDFLGEYTLKGNTLEIDQTEGKQTCTIPVTNGETNPVIVLPQTFSSNTILATVTLAPNGNQYDVYAQNLTLKAGERTILTLTLKPTQLPIQAITVMPWTEVALSKEISLSGISTSRGGTDNLAAINDTLELSIGSYRATYIYNGAIFNANYPLYWDRYTPGKRGPLYASFIPYKYPFGETAEYGEKDYLFMSVDNFIEDKNNFGKPINFLMDHLVVHLTVKLISNDGTYTADQLKAATLTVDANMTIGDKSDEFGSRKEEVAVAKTYKIYRDKDGDGQILLAEVNEASSSPYLKLTIDGKVYGMRVPIDNFKYNTHITLTADVTKYAMTKFNISVNPWIEASADGSFEY